MWTPVDQNDAYGRILFPTSTLVISCSQKVFGERDLESNPEITPKETAKISPFNNLGSKLTEEEELALQKTLARIRIQIKNHRPSVKPFFRDCDKISSAVGYVTKSQLRQCLAFMQCEVTNEEFELLCKKWKKHSPESETERSYIQDRGTNICYIHFLEEIEKDSDESTNSEAIDFNSRMQKKNKPKPKVAVRPHSDIEILMMKIKTKVSEINTGQD
jgi:hypothetical protein